jgi:hypothetical protein
MPDPETIDNLPTTRQAIEELFQQYSAINPYLLRAETIRRIEKITENPLLCYVTQTTFVPENMPPDYVSVDDSDIEGFDSLIDNALSKSPVPNVDIFVISNGGSPVAAERIVRLLRDNFKNVRFILTGNAFSAATMMSFACDSILMTDGATLGPIDPQVNGIPARTILRGFQDLEKRLQEEGPDALAAYIDLLRGYSLHLLEICKSAELLAKELAVSWLSQYMLKCPEDDPRVVDLVEYFANYDQHKSHGRSIGRKQASELGLKIEQVQRGTEIDRLVRSLNAQFTFFLHGTDFFKLYEDGHGTSWGRRFSIMPSSNNPQQGMIHR